jgi:2,4-dienoyl-CoA reductase-like NADH-dependent reductase (Old Yellow Enzyme family)
MKNPASDLEQGEPASLPLTFPCGLVMKNRFMLAPMTNSQSHEDGSLSDDEFNWLSLRAKGGFGLTMTCASHVQKVGQGFVGQLGIFSDDHIEGHSRLATAIKSEGSLAVIQLHHAGTRSPEGLIGQQAVCPSSDEETGARALRLEEVHELRDDFIRAAVRAKTAGYDGVEIHGAHGYILTQFISQQYNHRDDEYGGSLANRAKLVFEIAQGIRQECGGRFLLGVRLSPERYGLKLLETLQLAQQLIDSELFDFLDVSLWDCFKPPEEEDHKEQSLLEHVMSLDKKNVKLTVAGKIGRGKQVQEVLDAGADFVTIGRAAILHYDYPRRVIEDSDFEPITTPVSAAYLKEQGLGPAFVAYMRRWKNFVTEDPKE